MKMVALSDVCSLITDGTHYTPQNLSTGHPFLTVKDITADKLDFDNCSRISDADWEQAYQGNSCPQPGDILFSKDGTVGKVHMVGETEPFAVLSSIAILRPESELNSGYLRHALRAPAVLAQAVRRKSGSAIRRIILSDLKKVEIPLPTLSQQRRITAILDHADDMRTKRSTVLSKFDELPSAIFDKMFGDPVSNPKSWPMYRFEDQIESLQYGPRFHNEAYSSEGIRIVRITDLDRHGHLDFDSMPLMDVSDVDRAKYSLSNGDIVFARTGATVGKLALIGPQDPPCIAGAYFIRIRLRENIDPQYAAALLRTRSIQSIVVSGSYQSAQQNFSGPGLRALPFPCPPASLQRQFATAMRSLAERKHPLTQAVLRVDELFASLQSRAFRGEL